jgi:hypothetical protein
MWLPVASVATGRAAAQVVAPRTKNGNRPMLKPLPPFIQLVGSVFAPDRSRKQYFPFAPKVPGCLMCAITYSVLPPGQISTHIVPSLRQPRDAYSLFPGASVEPERCWHESCLDD